MKQVMLSVDDEVAALVDGAIKEYQDIKAGAGLTVEIGDALPIITSLAANYAKLPGDVKNGDDWAYLVKQVLGAIFPPVAPAPAAA